jgi:hypothetical protein
MEFFVEQQARFDQSMARLTSYQIDADARHTKEMADLRADLRRATHMAVEEFRRERLRRLEMYQELTAAQRELTAAQRELSAAQKVTEEKLQRLIDSLTPKQ